MQTDEGPKRQTMRLRTVVGLHGPHTTHDQNAFAVKACETFMAGAVKNPAQHAVEKISSPRGRGTFVKKPIHDETQRLRGHNLKNEPTRTIYEPVTPG
jgi:hypothetical protein